MSTKLGQTQRSKRQLANKAPKLIENVKGLIGIKGPKTSSVITEILKDLHKFKSPESKLLTKRNITRPFEDVSSVEFLGKVNDSSLFSYGSHSKKRPNNLVLGRLFDFQLLDMFEFGLNTETFKGMDSFDGVRKAVVRAGSKPILIFQGDAWDANSDLVMLRNFFLDFFRGETLQKINLSSLDRVIIFTASNEGSTPQVFFRHYGVSLKKSSSALPRVELDEVGPRMDLILRRRKSASEAISKESLRQPKQTSKEGNHEKNKERNKLGEKSGRIHMQKQDLGNLNVQRLKGLKGTKRKQRDGEDGLSETDGGASEPNDDGMTDIDTPARSRSNSVSRPSSAASSASSTAKKMRGSFNSMDEFASRGGSAGSVTSTSTNGRRESNVDKNLVKQKAGGYGTKPIEGGYRNVAKKKKTEK